MVETEKIALQIAILREIYPKENINQLAARLMFSPIFIINAIERGEELGYFVRKKGKKGELTDTLVDGKKLEYTYLRGDEVGDENYRIQYELLHAIVSANNDEMDIEEGTLNYWCRGIKPAEVEIALHILNKVGAINSYTIADPKDKKSIYKFYSLAINSDKRWGYKQFKTK